MQESRVYEASDPRDLVYGILGMADTLTRNAADLKDSSVHQNIVTIDYSKSVSEVFQEVVKYVINRDRDLDILSRYEIDNGNDTDLPSWTPDWRDARHDNKVLHILGVAEGGHTAGGLEAPFQYESDTGALRLSGIIIASITAPYPPKLR